MGNDGNVYACTAGVQNGRARCRNAAVNGSNRCAIHADGNPAPLPDIVLVKVNLNEKWNRLFADAGVPELYRSFQRSSQLGNEHVARAKSLGRDPFAIREGSGRNNSTPESADSGTPVFGKGGLSNASIVFVVRELRNAGFMLTGAHRLNREHKPPVRLVLEFTRYVGTATKIAFPNELFETLVLTNFGQVDVWANDRDSRGKVIHTINCGKRDDSARSQFYLEFGNGDWAATPTE